MPGATWVGPHHDNGLMRAAGPNVIVFHTIVGHDPAHAAHLSIGGYGELSQSRDTAYQSAACKNGNPRAIAVETEDLGPPFPAWNTDNGHDVPAWTDAQLDRAVDCCLFAYHAHGVPLVAAADSKVGSAGVAYHRQGIDGNFAAEGYAYGGRVPDGEVWTDYPGKVCPGDRRIKQLLETVIPRARVLAGLNQPEEDMSDWVEARLYALDQMQEKVGPGPNADRAGIVGEPVPMVTELKYIAMRLYRFLLLNPDQSGGNAPPSEGPLPAIDALVYVRDTVKQLAGAVAGLSVAGADPAAVADHLAGDLEWTGRLAEAIAAAQDRRARDGDPGTGPVT